MSTCFFSKIVYKMDKIIVRQDNLGKKNGKRMVGLSYNHPLTGFFAFAAPAPNKGGGVIPSTHAGNSVGGSPTVGGRAFSCF
jgi:hypothetical protein